MQICGSNSGLFKSAFDWVMIMSVMSQFFFNIAWLIAETFLNSLPAFKDNNQPIEK